jgi:hypothetical protein
VSPLMTRTSHKAGFSSKGIREVVKVVLD